MEPKISEIVSKPLEYPERSGAGIMSTGIHGETSRDALLDRARRIEGWEKRNDFRDCIPCDRCTNCLEIRGFTTKGEERVLALYCQLSEKEVSAFNTCNMATRSRSGRKKVIYDLTFAPKGFSEGFGSIKDSKVVDEPKMPVGEVRKTEPTIPSDGAYRGGSKYYKRADGDNTAKGSGVVPMQLRN